MNCLTSLCYVCLKTKHKALGNVNSAWSANRDVLHILGYLPCNLAWLKTKALVLICDECCLRLRETYLFLAMCRTNSAVLRGYMGDLNTASASNADNNDGGEIKLETKAIIREEVADAVVNVGGGGVVKRDDNKSGASDLRQAHLLYLSGGKKHKDVSTSGGSAKKSKKDNKGTGNSAGKAVLPKQAHKRYLKDVAEYAQWMQPQEERQQQQEKQRQQQEKRRQQRQLQQEQRQLRKEQKKLKRPMQKSLFREHLGQVVRKRETTQESGGGGSWWRYSSTNYV